MDITLGYNLSRTDEFYLQYTMHFSWEADSYLEQQMLLMHKLFVPTQRGKNDPKSEAGVYNECRVLFWLDEQDIRYETGHS